MAAVKDAFEILGYSSIEKMESEIFGISRTPKKKAPVERKDSELKVAYNRWKTDICGSKRTCSADACFVKDCQSQDDQELI